MQHLQEIGTQQYAAPVPPMNNQQSFSRPPLVGQQNLPGPQMHPHLMPAQSMAHSQISSPPVAPVSHMSPRLPVGPQPHGQPPIGYHTQVTSSSSTMLPQSGVGPYNSAPPLPAQTVASPTGLSQYESRQFAPPLSTAGQQPITTPPGHGFPQARPPQYVQNAPPMPSQTMTNSGPPGLVQPGQRQYSSAPPLPGQALSSPLGMNRMSPGNTPDYQQQPGYQQPGYHNQMVCEIKYFFFFFRKSLVA